MAKKKTASKAPRVQQPKVEPDAMPEPGGEQPQTEFRNARHVSVQTHERLFVSLSDVKLLLREKFGNEGSDVQINSRGAVIASVRVQSNDEGI
jgi:hypothetical protein